MANFAVLDGENVLNVILADSKTIAEEITGKVCIEFTTEPAEPGGTYANGIFLKRKPYPSWILNSKNEWVAPVPAPEFNLENPIDYYWNESTISWVSI